MFLHVPWPTLTQPNKIFHWDTPSDADGRGRRKSGLFGQHVRVSLKWGLGASECLKILDGYVPYVYTSVLGGGERYKILIRGVTLFRHHLFRARFFSYSSKLPLG